MNFLKNIFGKREADKFTDYSSLNSDMHSHLIHGIDDGSQSMEESLELVKKFYHLGYRKLITTPHVISDKYKNTPEIISSGFQRLETAVKTTGLPITLGYAAEYLIDDRFEEKIKNNTLLTFGKKFVLVEIPFIQEPKNLYEIIYELQVNGYKVILAHTERYSFWYGNAKKYEELFDREIYMQLNILSLAGYYSPATRKAAEWLVDNDMIKFLGTDCHNLVHIEKIAETLKEKHVQKLLGSGKLLNYSL